MAIGGATDWARVQDALRSEVERVTALLRTVADPTAPAVGRWNLGDVAMHLSQAWLAIPRMASDELSGSLEAIPGFEARGVSFLSDLRELGDATVSGVDADPERDLRVLAGRIGERAEAFFAAVGEASPSELRPWLVEGVKVPLSTLACHLLNETVVHGYDIARADGQAWPIDRSRAALVVEGFLFPVMQALDPHALVDDQAAAGRQVAYELRLRGAGRHVFAFADGVLTLDGPEPPHRIDCRLSVDPAALLLVAWGRVSQWSAIARGQMLAWGRKPWLGPKLRTLMRNP